MVRLSFFVDGGVGVVCGVRGFGRWAMDEVEEVEEVDCVWLD